MKEKVQQPFPTANNIERRFMAKPLQSGVSQHDIVKQLQLLYITPFNGNLCKLYFHLAKNCHGNAATDSKLAVTVFSLFYPFWPIMVHNLIDSFFAIPFRKDRFAPAQCHTPRTLRNSSRGHLRRLTPRSPQRHTFINSRDSHEADYTIFAREFRSNLKSRSQLTTSYGPHCDRSSNNVRRCNACGISHFSPRTKA